MPYRDKVSTKNPWIGQIKIDGRKIKHRCATKREAVEWETRERQRLQQGVQDLTTPTASLLEWATAYLDFSQKKFVEKTYEEKKRAFQCFFNGGFSPDSAVTSLTPLALLKFFQSQAEKRSGHAANKDRKNLSAAWSWGRDYFGLPGKILFKGPSNKAKSDRNGVFRHCLSFGRFTKRPLNYRISGCFCAICIPVLVVANCSSFGGKTWILSMVESGCTGKRTVSGR